MKKGQTIVRILLCDDDPQDRKLIKAYLQQRADREIVILEAGQTDEIRDGMAEANSRKSGYVPILL